MVAFQISRMVGMMELAYSKGRMAIHQLITERKKRRLTQQFVSLSGILLHSLPYLTSCKSRRYCASDTHDQRSCQWSRTPSNSRSRKQYIAAINDELHVDGRVRLRERCLCGVDHDFRSFGLLLSIDLRACLADRNIEPYQLHQRQ